MASKVNTKFIVVLSAVLLVLAIGVGVLGAMVVFKSADDHLKRGDRWMSEGNYIEASKSYGKAVNKEPFNVAYLRKWLDAVTKSAPELDTDYRTMYQRDYLGALRQIATVLDTDPQAQRDFLEVVFRQLKLGGAGGEAWGSFIESLVPRYEQLDMTQPEAQALLRYRGLASVYRFRTLDTVDQRERSRAKDDLDRAFRADPTDMDVALARVELIAAEAMSLQRGGRPQEARERWREAFEASAEVRRRFPSAPQPLLRDAILRIEAASQAGPTNEQAQAMVAEIDAALETVARLAHDSEGVAGDETFLAQYSRASEIVGTREASQRWLDLLERLIEKSEFKEALYIEKARTLASMGRHEEAIEILTRVSSAPNLPISMEGLILRELRINAVRLQAESALALWAQAGADAKPAAMARVKQYRDQLATRVAADSSAMLRVNAQIAFAERRLDDAVDSLSQLRRLTGGRDTEILSMLARALEAQDKIGAAAQQYRRIFEMEPGNVQALLSLLNLELRAGNREEARELILAAEKLIPGNEIIERAKQMISVLEGAGLATNDPVMNVLNGSLRIRTGANADMDKAAEFIAAGVAQFPNDPRLYIEQITIEAQAGRKDRAIEFAEAAKQRFPDNPQFMQIHALLLYDDPIQARLQMIEAMEDLSPIDRTLARAGVYMGLNREEELEQELAKARAIDADNPMLLEMQFVRSLTKKDFAAARQLTQRAAALDLDGVRGQLYQARLEIAEGKAEQAVATLDRITRDSEYNLAAWRLLATAQLESGRIDDSMRSFERALSIKPDDMPTIAAYIAAMRSLGRSGDALTLARRAMTMRNADSTVGNARLELEEQVGDARYAIEQRLRRRAGDPGDRANNLALARLFIREGMREQAEQILTSMRGAGNTPDLPLALVEARFFAASGDVRRGVDVIQNEISRLPENQRGAGYVALSEYLFERQLPAEAVAALERARDTQGDLMPVDRRLGDYFFSIGDYDRAVEYYKSVIDAGSDRDSVVSKRLVEAHLRTGRLDEAERVLARIEGAGGPDVQVLLLRSQIALDRQQPLEARRLLDRAIEMDPRSTLAFIKRAQLGFADDSQFAAVLRDLRQASQLQPENLVVRRMLSQLFLRRGRVNEAIDELAQAVRARPENDSIRYEYIRLIGQHGTTDQMLAAIQQAVADRGEQAPQWFMMAGDALLASGDSARATQLFERAYAGAPSPSTLSRLIDAYLNARPPRTQQAAQALAGFNASTSQQQLFAALLRARVEAAAGNQRAALQLFAQTWQASAESPAATRLWFEQTRTAFGQNTRDMLAFIDQLPAQTEQGPTPTATVILASMRSSDPSQAVSALDSLAGLERRTDDPGTLLELARVRGQILYVQGDFAAAAQSYRDGLRLAPDDVELNNNLAYTLAKQLRQPQVALPYATKASELAPFNANVLDTLGVIYMLLGRNTQADATFARALDSATSDLDRVPIHAHMAQIKQKLGDTAAASRNARLAVQLGEATPGAEQLYREEINEARRIASGGQ